MKNAKIFSKSLKFLFLMVLVVISFFRGEHQIWFLAGAFAIWAVTIITAFVMANRKWISQKLKKLLASKPAPKRTEPIKKKPQHFIIPDLTEPPELILLRHVNCRITEKLKSAFPEATWDWCAETPVKLASVGGTGKIRTSNTGIYNFADVTIDQYARIRFQMMQVVPLESIGEVSSETKTSVSPAAVMEEPEPVVDVEVWYDIMGRDVLTKLITDLNARGHSTLYIKESGEVCITEADTEVAQEQLDNLPGKKFWPELAKVFEKSELTPSLSDDRIQLSW